MTHDDPTGPDTIITASSLCWDDTQITRPDAHALRSLCALPTRTDPDPDAVTEADTPPGWWCRELPRLR